MERLNIFVAGRWREGRGEEMASVFPADGSVNARLRAANVEDVNEAVEAAERAWRAPEWRGLVPHQRASILYRVSNLILAQQEQLAELQTRDNGKPLAETRGLVASAAAAFNCLIEERIDARMKRTAWRPTARGELSERQALAFSAVLCAAAAYLYLPGTYAELGSSDETVAQLVGDPRRAALLAVVLGIVRCFEDYPTAVQELILRAGDVETGGVCVMRDLEGVDSFLARV